MELTERELREKVVAGLAACMPQTEADAATSCSGGCPYFENPCCGDYQDNDHVNLPIRLIEDVRKLLKAQDAVEPKLVGVNTWSCGECGALLGWEEFTPSGMELVEYKFCPNCGRAVKWE